MQHRPSSTASEAEPEYDQHDINFLTGFANVLAEAVARAGKNRAMSGMLEQQRLMAEELQHRVRNNLQVVSGMLSNYARNTADDTTRHGISAISSRVMTLAQIYDSLLGLGLSETVDLSDYLKQLCASLPGLQDISAGTVDLRCEVEPIMLPLNSVTSLGMAVAELVTNSYRHAFRNQNGLITVSLARSTNGETMTLTVRDNGIGFVTVGEDSRRGLSLVRTLVQGMGGSLNVEANAGTRWTLSFPVAAAISWKTLSWPSSDRQSRLAAHAFLYVVADL